MSVIQFSCFYSAFICNENGDQKRRSSLKPLKLFFRCLVKDPRHEEGKKQKERSEQKKAGSLSDGIICEIGGRKLKLRNLLHIVLNDTLNAAFVVEVKKSERKSFKSSTRNSLFHLSTMIYDMQPFSTRAPSPSINYAAI